MTRLTVSPTSDFLLRDGKPFFYLADTAWAAFANLPIEDWGRYLEARRLQGFNALQISILPITHDDSVADSNIAPFLSDQSGNWVFDQYNPDYFDKAVAMIEAAVEHDFVPVLGVLWANYVPGTRFEQKSPVQTAMPLQAVVPYATYVAKLFKPYNPTYFISGDTHFDVADEEHYYRAALEAVKAVDSDALLTMHLGPDAKLPLSLGERIDYYMYQSGHHNDRLDRPYTLADYFTAYPIKRPIVNSEPPYEGHGRVGTNTRFNAFDVRKATWQSILAGAKMGICYGGHGIWSFHRRGMDFLNKGRSFEPYDWDEALTLDGGWDVSFVKWVFETNDLFDLEPVDIVDGDDPEIRAAMSPDRTKLAVYLPYGFDIDLDIDLTGYDCVQIDLEKRRITTPKIIIGARSHVPMLRSNADSLLLATKR